MKNSYYGIAPLDLSRLENTKFVQLATESYATISRYAKHTTTPIFATVYTSKLAEMERLLAEFNEGLHKVRGSKVAAKLESLDQERDDALVTLTSVAKSYKRSKTPAIVTAYENLDRLFNGYKNITATSYEEETGSINHLLMQLAKVEYQSDIDTLHLQPMVEALKESQVAFEAAYAERVQEQTGITKSNSKALREELQEIYTFLVDYTALQAYAFPDDSELVTLRDELNTHRSRQKATMKKAKTEKEDN